MAKAISEVWVRDMEIRFTPRWSAIRAATPLSRKRRAARRLVYYFKIDPANTPAPTCTDGFHTGFFGGKPGCKALGWICLSGGIGALTLRVDPIQETFSVAGDALPNSGHFRKIGADA